ncbi:D-alanyl-D-alanine carboxypeptidase [Romboutsia lituseburensis]|uniref:D-alanyl-D-alanine carboxypeptidase n=1 Tax=Romboutsia lituseburensis TaxID=1537 RepID=UPI000E188854|nr:D-alanyl-D-alanine carboxypeptidase [Romboutsia lituseburensis]CEH35596.1 D-alanyl-D-alanine carboxypeptidase [Romboutsia lituseburensis]
MKKINKSILSILIMVICFSITGFNNKVEADGQKPQVYAHAYVVMDAKTGEVLHSQDMNKKIYPASTTKMLTALVALDNCSLSKKITIKQSVLDNTPSIATQAGLKAGIHIQ